MTRIDLLETIVAATRRTVESRRARVSAAELERLAETTSASGDAFRRSIAETGRLNVIAECKRRSPSRGVLRADYDAALIARAYAAAGAAAISVLTEPTFFDGSLEDLRRVRAAVTLPVLRKDFIVAEYQLLEARAAGADAVLLIAAALEAGRLTSLLESAGRFGLAALVEVHDAAQLACAVDAGATVIGVNNRNLRTLEVAVDVARTLIERMPRGVIAVAESGLRRHEDLLELRRAGYQAFLIGEALMQTADPGAALARMIGRREAVGGSPPGS